MKMDLQDAPAPQQVPHAEVCIVGAGIAGLVLAHRLADRGLRVTLLEAGGGSLSGAAQGWLAAEFPATPHRGTAEGRFAVFGGTSLRWGGQLLAAPSDLAWPLAAAELVAYEAEAAKLLGVDSLPWDAAEFFAAIHQSLPHVLHGAGLRDAAALDCRLSKWTPFGRRNLAHTLGRELLANPRVTTLLHAPVAELVVSPQSNHVLAVRVALGSGATLRLEADQFVLAAGTVETVRLLLASPLAAGLPALGHNFHDHLTLPAAEFSGEARGRAVRELRPWIARGVLHSAKLEASPRLRAQLDLPPVLAHVTFTEPEDSGLAVVRELLTARQRGELPATLARALPQLAPAARQAARLAWEARVARRRYLSPATRVHLVLNAAQPVPTSSRITLSEQPGPHGVRLPRIDWRVQPSEVAALRRFAAYLREQIFPWPGMDWSPELFAGEGPLPALDDARHAMGGACLGSDLRASVVDAALRVHGVDNLSVASAAVFPDGAPPLPTLPLLALTLRLAERLATPTGAGWSSSARPSPHPPA